MLVVAVKRMQRGIVVEVQAKHWVVMTTDGAFINVPLDGSQVQIGEEIAIESKAVLPSINWKIFMSGAVAALLAFFFLFPTFTDNPAQAQTFVYVEIRPSVKIGLNKSNKVVVIRPVNSEAKKLVSKLAWKEEPVEKVVVDYLKTAKSQGFIQKKESLVLSTVNQSDKFHKQMLHSIRSTIETDEQIGKNKLNLNVYAFSVPTIVESAAKSSGMTPGKYGFWLLSKKSGKNIDIDDLAKNEISDLTSDADVSEYLDHPPTEKEWKELVKNNKGEVKDPTPVKEKPVEDDPNKQKTDETQPPENQKDIPEKDGTKKPADQNPTNSTDKKNDTEFPSSDGKADSQKPEEKPEDQPLQKDKSDSQTTAP